MNQPFQQDLLTPFESQHLIENIKAFPIEEYCSIPWLKQDENLQRLNIQAHLNALIKTDEYITDYCATYDKVRILISDLIVSEMWKKHVLPHLIEFLSENQTYRQYVAFYHEGVVCNILEVLMFNRTAIDSADDFILEVIDYCFRKLTQLISKPPPKTIEKLSIEEVIKKSKKQEIQEQLNETEFNLQIMCISIIRYITDHAKHLQLAVLNKLVIDNDVYCMLVPLIELKPWFRNNHKGDREVYENSKWIVLEKSDYSKLAKVEAQVWIAIYNLFMENECRKKYEINDFRKNNLLRLRKYMNEILLDQIPQLSQMLRALEELSLMNVNNYTSSNSFVVQAQIDLVQSITKNKNWAEIAEIQKKKYFTVSKEQNRVEMMKMANMYSSDIMEGLMDGFHCAKCKKSASKRCSQCKQVWYCSRECQVGDWPNHKALCKTATVKQQVKQEKEEIKTQKVQEQQVEAKKEEVKTKVEEITTQNLDELE